MNDDRLRQLQERARLATEVGDLLELLRAHDMGNDYRVTITHHATGSFPLSAIGRELVQIGRSEKIRMLENQLERLLGGCNVPKAEPHGGCKCGWSDEPSPDHDEGCPIRTEPSCNPLPG